MAARRGKAVRVGAAILALATSGLAGNANALLLDRGPDMVYDTVLDITWVRDASLCVTLNNCVNDTLFAGLITWDDANQWAADLVFGGFSDWRLPFASVAAGAGPTAVVHTCTGAGGADEVACRDNEMGYMFYYNLDGNLFDNKTGTQPAVGGEMLTGIQLAYWSGSEFDSVFAWGFIFFNGFRGSDFKVFRLSAWAVRPGDVAAVPEPSVLLLFGVGALGLALSRRRGRRR